MPALRTEARVLGSPRVVSILSAAAAALSSRVGCDAASAWLSSRQVTFATPARSATERKASEQVAMPAARPLYLHVQIPRNAIAPHAYRWKTAYMAVLRDSLQARFLSSEISHLSTAASKLLLLCVSAARTFCQKEVVMVWCMLTLLQ